MKKFLNISVIAALAILPLAANAAVTVSVDTDPGATNANAPVATNPPKYSLATATVDDETNVATASYVKGAYNAAIKAINNVATTADGAVKGVKVNGSPLTLTNGIADVTVTESANNGKISVNGADVAVHGLGSAAYTDSDAYATAAQGAKADTALQKAAITSGTGNGTIAVDGTDVAVAGLKSAAYAETTAFDAAGAANTAETNAKAYADGLANNYATAAQGAKADTALQASDVDQTYDATSTNAQSGVAVASAISAAGANYAKKTGVVTAIQGATITATVPTVKEWGTETAGTASVTVSRITATYPAND